MSLFDADETAAADGSDAEPFGQHVRAEAASVVRLDSAGLALMERLAARGIRIIGVDVSLDVVRSVRSGSADSEGLAEGVRAGRVDATQNIIAAVIDTDVTLLPVDDIVFARQAARAIGQALSIKDGYHVIMLCGQAGDEGAVEMVARACETASGKRLGVDFGLAIGAALWRGDATAAMPMRSSDRRAAAWAGPLYEKADSVEVLAR